MSGDELTPLPDDGQPFDPYYTDVEPTTEGFAGVWANRRVRNGLIAAGVVAGAIFVIGINDGSSGDADSALRSREEATVTTTTTVRDRDAVEDEDVDDAGVAVARSLEDVTTPRGPRTLDEVTYVGSLDDEPTADTVFVDDSFDDEFTDDDDFFSDDFFSDDFFADDDDDPFFRPTTGSGNRLNPRPRFTPAPTARANTANTTTTAPAEETTTTEAATTTAEETTTSSSSTTTSTEATSATTTSVVTAPTWGALTQGLTCPNPVSLWVRGATLLAVASGASAFAFTGDTWAAVTAPVTGDVRALAAHPNVPSVRWAAGSGGVARLDGMSQPVVINAAPDVESLAVTPDGGTLLAAAPTALHKSDGQTTWQPVTPTLAADERLSSVYVHDDLTAFLGTTRGVRRSGDDGSTWQPVPNVTSGVVGSPVFANGVLTWLRSDSAGVLRWNQSADVWTAVDYVGTVRPDASARVAALPDGSLLSVGAGKLITSTDGASWVEFKTALPANYQPAGVARHGTATFVWAPDCRADFILRLLD